MQKGDDLIRFTIRGAIGVFCAAALVLITMILTSTKVEEETIRALFSAIALAVFSLTATAGLHLAVRRPSLAAIGYLTMLVSVLAFSVAFAMVWSLIAFQELGLYPMILALALGHTCVLLASVARSDSESVRLLRVGTVVALWVVTILVVALIDGNHSDFGDTDFKATGVVAVLYLLGTLLLPLLRRTEGPPGVRRGGPGAGRPTVAGLESIALDVTDRDRSDRFYVEVLGATIEPGREGRVAYRVGDQRLEVHEAAPQASDGGGAATGNRLSFVWSGTPESAVTWLQDRGIEILEGPELRDGAETIGVSVCCQDPDGSLIELISYG